MVKRLCYLSKGETAVVVRIKKAPRLQAIGLTPGALVCCRYKSSCVMVLEVKDRMVAVRSCDLRRVWADY